jgi:hypothetical protein
MSDAAHALRAAIHAHLTGDPELVACLGGPNLYDEPPRAAAGAYLVFARWEAEDASTPEQRATRHGFDLAVWPGQAAATAKALDIAGHVERLLHDANLAPAGHRLVYLFWESSAAVRDERSKLPRVTLAFRALTEAL